ncbi:MAG TPA: tetratricopeptide repeat-containing diguanylate cyclase [Hyphomicrobiales bacterium]|nr:tetratricopeptide repeat-containing diguanylate cyclase [Hyphomicrobiales bacterium]
MALPPRGILPRPLAAWNSSMLRHALCLSLLWWLAPAQAQDAAPATPEQQAEALVREADSLVTRTLYAQAAQLLSQAYDLTAATPDSPQARSVLNSLANLHYSTGQFALAQNYYQELATLDEAGGDLPALSVSLYNLGHAEASQQDFSDATRHFSRSLELSLQLDDQSGAAYTLKAMAVNLQAQQQPFSALPLLDQSLALFEQLGESLQAAVVKRHLGDVELDLEHPAAAVAYYEAALPALIDNDYSEAILKVYRGLSLANEALGELKRALVFQRAYTDLLQLELNQQNQESTQRLQVELQTRRYADANERLQALGQRQRQELAVKEQLLHMQQLVLLLGGTLLVLALAMLWHARHNARHMHRLANTDALTSLRNRRSVMAAAQREWERAQRFGRPLCCLVFDVDHFKDINDTYGHGSGDTVLKAIARVLQTSLRPSDLIGRIGGEGFLVVATETSQAQGKALAERLRQAVSLIVIPGIRNRQLTVSIGVATREGAASLEQLIHQADQALYEAKAGGRNQVGVHGEVPRGLLFGTTG